MTSRFPVCPYALLSPLLLVFVLLACGDEPIETESGQTCDAVAGVYRYTSERNPSAPGRCPASFDALASDVVAIARRIDGLYDVRYGGIEAVCPLVDIACVLHLTCDIRSPSGETEIGYQIYWTLSAAGFDGTLTLLVASGVDDAGPEGCQANYRTNGVRM